MRIRLSKKEAQLWAAPGADRDYPESGLSRELAKIHHDKSGSNGEAGAVTWVTDCGDARTGDDKAPGRMALEDASEANYQISFNPN